jgi:hypothetical protein
MRNVISFLPIITTVVALAFSNAVFQRWRKRKSGPHLLWWAGGILTYGLGTLTEALTTLFGWQENVFRAWYILGALLGAAPLAQGTVYLLLSRRVANRLTIALVAFFLIASSCVLIAPIDYSLVERYRLTGHVFAWPWVRFFSPFINTYAAVFLIGGALFSAVRYSRDVAQRQRAVGNVLIALGAILPGIGGTATRMGHTEVLYVTELIGLIVIALGYRLNVRASAGGNVRTPEPQSSWNRADA